MEEVGSMLLKALKQTANKTKDDKEPMPPLQAQARAEQLTEYAVLFHNKRKFLPGELVTIDPVFGFNKRCPRPGEPGVVLEVDYDRGPPEKNTGQELMEDTLVMVCRQEGGVFIFWYSYRELIPFILEDV